MEVRMMAVAVAVAVAAAGAVVAGPARSAAAGSCQPSVSVGNAPKVSEDQGPLRFAISVAPPPAGCDFQGSVGFQTEPAAGNPTPNVDYKEMTGTVSWPLNTPIMKIVEVPIYEDQQAEPDETVELCLHSPVGVTIVSWCGAGQIKSTPICVRPEGDQSAACWIPVQPSQPGGTAVTVDYSTVAGTATPGQDYVGVTGGRLTIPAGASEGLAPVEVLAGRPGDPDERFELDYRLTRDGVPETGRFTVVIVR
ncbi:Calx-beta domain-containing protein [Saccharothrix sp. HUAS TT1]|uniref:Calx-beta domain-containing protein n=1 Tax=unclassified Saccharothrix TaxID=2593673 RepID=UPI00345C2E88